MTRRRLPFVLVLFAVTAACTSGATGSAASAAASAPTSGAASPTAAIEHPTGAAEVVLRLEEGGGLIPMESFPTQAPTFTLFGDGTVIWRDIDAALPVSDPDGAAPLPAFSTGRLDEAAVQELLSFAIDRGGLGIARDGRYDNPTVADGLTTIFTLAAGGLTKTVEIYGLGMEDGPGVPDVAARTAFLMLADRLRHFGRAIAQPPVTYEPLGYRVTLLESQGRASIARDWPWPAITPADFVADPVGGARRRTMSPAEIAAIGIAEPNGGISGLAVTGPDGSTEYLVAVRPLFPDETS